MPLIELCVKPNVLEVVRPHFLVLAEKMANWTYFYLGVPDVDKKEFRVFVPIFQLNMPDLEVIVDDPQTGMFATSKEQRRDYVKKIKRVLTTVLGKGLTISVRVRCFTNITFSEFRTDEVELDSNELI